jgi:hypothetical protein
MATALVLGISVAKNFDCLTHQFSEGQGPAIDVLGAEGVDGLRALLSEMIALEADQRQLVAAAKAGDTSQAANDHLRAVMDRSLELGQSVLLQRFFEAESSGDICPPLY